MRAQEIGAELLVCSDSNSWDCNGGDADTSAAATDLVDCIAPVSEIRLAFDENTEIAHNNLGYVSCNPMEYGGNRLWEQCQGSQSKFCVVGATGNQIEAVGHTDTHAASSTSVPPDNPITGTTQWLGGMYKHWLDPAPCTAAELADPNQDTCINGYTFMGRNNDDCMEGMVFDKASKDIPNFQLRINTMYGLYMGNTGTPGKAFNPQNPSHEYTPWLPRNLEYSGLDYETIGTDADGNDIRSYHLDLHFTTPKKNPTNPSYGDKGFQAYEWPDIFPYLGTDPATNQGRMLRTPTRWSFWQGEPDATKIAALDGAHVLRPGRHRQRC